MPVDRGEVKGMDAGLQQAETRSGALKSGEGSKGKLGPPARVTKSNHSASTVTLSGLLNAIDGVASQARTLPTLYFLYIPS